MKSFRKANPDKKISILIYGRDGLGKSSFGSKFPAPIFVGPEIDGSDFLTDFNGDPITLDEGSKTFEGLMITLDFLLKNKHEFKTVVLDSLDWIETSIQEDIIKKYKVSNMNLACGGYGAGYRESLERQTDLMKKLFLLKDKMNIVAVAHSNQVKLNDSILQAEYMKTDLKIHESANISPRSMWREAFDAVVLLDQEVQVEHDGNKVKTKFDDTRILRFEGTERFAAKNRWTGFPSKIVFKEEDNIYKKIKDFIITDFHKKALEDYKKGGLNKPKLLEYINNNKKDKAKLIAVINKIKGKGKTKNDLQS